MDPVWCIPIVAMAILALPILDVILSCAPSRRVEPPTALPQYLDSTSYSQCKQLVEEYESRLPVGERGA